MTHFKLLPTRTGNHVFVRVLTAIDRDFSHDFCGALFFTEREWDNFQFLLDYRSDNIEIALEKEEDR